ncbi:MAG: DUF4159 domain-containing protein [Alphaproteobacteria bacterium]
MTPSLLSFAAPMALWALLILPLIWWLLRLTPPSPKRQIFPALELLRDLPAVAQTPAHTPWWLLLLRLMIVALVILGLARPVFAPPATLPGQGPFLLVIDNGWVSAANWLRWQEFLDDFCQQAGRAQRNLLLLPTAPSRQQGLLNFTGQTPAQTACAQLAQLKPLPWPTDHAAAQKLLRQEQNAGHIPGNTQIIWLNDGIYSAATESFYGWLQQNGLSKLYQSQSPLYLLHPSAQSRAKDLTATLERAATGSETDLTIEARDSAGRLRGNGIAHFAARDKTAPVTIALPGTLRNQITRLNIAGQNHAGSVLLLDDSYARHHVGLVGDESIQSSQPLLSSLYYLDRALADHHTVQSGVPADLIAAHMPVIINAADRALTPMERDQLAQWVNDGGVLAQCAGPALETEDATLLPVTLRADTRNLGGTLSWEQPQKLRPFPPKSPFVGLSLPDDVTVTRQILADPAGLLPDSSWAMLADGTPVVTGTARGRGYVALIHVPCNPDWSNLPMTGLFVHMLDRLVALGVAGTIPDSTSPLPPWRVLDGFGTLQSPAADQISLTGAAQKNFTPAPEHPPGLYGTAAGRRAFNLGPSQSGMIGFQPGDAEALVPQQGGQELRPLLLMLALILFLGDFLLALILRGLLATLRTGSAAFLLCLAFAAPAQAADGVAMTEKTWIGVVSNGAGDQESTAMMGLTALTGRVLQKTALDDIGIAKVNLETDDLSFYPFLYWPLTQDPGLSPGAQQKLQNYFARGGMILINLTGTLRHNPALAASGVAVPPLQPLPTTHTLLHTFYLLKDCPGRLADGELWTERDVTMRHDGVPAIFVGNRDWAGAWARGSWDNTRVDDMALRCGINFIIYALTGNYKADQIHVQSILERRGK